jgi:chromatin remodeling complex protein RSC6
MSDTESNAIENQFKTVQDSLTSITGKTKELMESIKILQRTCKQEEKLAKHKKKKVQTKLNLSKDLEKFLSVEHGTKLTKAEVMKAVSSYIKDNNLQLEDNKRRFKPNKKLHSVFGMSPKTNLTFVEINKHVSSHLSK